MKGGRILEARQLEAKSCFTFGRSPGCDWVLEHPSISRVHAVIQFNQEQLPYLYDFDSVHGTFKNKRRIRPRVYGELKVGDMIKFGQSSRTFILGGPQELMPEEGLSKAQRQHLSALEAKERRRMREEEVAKAQMAAALNHGISWGMGADATADEEDEGRVPSVDWRAYSQTHALSEKQQNLADKIRRMENRVRNLTNEAEKIKAKQSSMEELTPGQAATLARNEQVIDTTTEELEDLEEALNESIAESLRSKKSKLEADTSRKRRKSNDEEEEEGSTDEDEFYDRTTLGRAKKRKAAPVVHDAASLFGRKEALLEEKARLELLLAKEAEGASRQAPVSGGNPSTPGDPSKLTAADPLDAFMSNVAVQLEQGKVEKMRKEIAVVAEEIEGLEQLLKKADPDGYFRAGTHAARVAREKGLRLYNQDKEQKAALEKKKRQEAAAKAAKEAAEKLFVPEEEEETICHTHASEPETLKPTDRAAGDLALVHRLEPHEHQKAGLEIPKPSGTQTSRRSADYAPSQEKANGVQDVTGVAEGFSSGLQARQSKQERDAHIRATLAKEKALKASQASGGAAGGEEALLADLALLKSVTQMDSGDGTSLNKVNIEETGWKPPEGQTGDGRTVLNAKLGY